jgi:entericidin B
VPSLKSWLRIAQTCTEIAMTRPLILCLALFALSACETAKGAGRDLQKAGDAITDTATDVQKAL